MQLKGFWLKKLIHILKRQPDEAGNKRGGMPCMVYFARFLERLHGFFGKLRNCLCMLFLCLDSLSLPFMCVWALKLPYHSSWVFCTKKNTLSKKNRVSREDGPRFVFANVVACFLERASTRRSLALFAERGSFRNPLDFLCIQRLYGVLVLQFPIGIEWIRRRHFFPSTQRLDLKNSLRLSHILVGGGDGTLVCLP